jgi:glycosyltransferase involved in cell wall biosynthesis
MKQDLRDKQDPPRLSVAVIAKNEADRIGRLLDSVQMADEVVVVDSGSSDGTVELCRGHGFRVVHHDWQGYVIQKQVAQDLCLGEWILNLDADEALSGEGAAEILREIDQAGPDVAGFSLPRISWYLNKWIKHGGWYPDRKVRLVRRDRGKWVGDGIHERLEVDGEIKSLNHPILHYVYRDISDQVATMNRFSTVTAEHRKKPASKLYLFWGLAHAVGKFLECAVWKLGLLDGAAGFVIAVNSAFYVFLKHAKAWEKTQPKTEPGSPA